MKISAGGIDSSEWTAEPVYPGTDPEPIVHAEDCDEEARATYCKVSWVNYHDKRESGWWLPCRF